MQHLYQSVFYSEKVNNLFTDEAMIGYMLQFEAALVKAQESHNVIPASAAEIIEGCCRVENINIAQIAADSGLGGNVNIPLIKQLTAVVKQKDAEGSKYIHFGATSQDVIDTAMMLQARDALTIIADDLKQLIKQLASLAEEHRETVMIGRSFMQHARPITFGYKVAGWLDALLRSKKNIEELLQEGFALQLGGAVGTLSGTHQTGVQVSETMSELLGLHNPSKPWHTERDRFVAIASTLGMLAGNIGKIAKDISLLMQTEIAEVFEPSAEGKGGSSTMPHKRNPVGCIAILANATRIPALVATMFSCMTQDHERATGLWHAEWETLSDIVKLTAGAVTKAVDLTNGLEVNVQKMRINLEITNGLIYAENISMVLADKIGRANAHDLIEQCCAEAVSKSVHLKDVIIMNKVISQELSKLKIEEQFDSFKSLGLADNYTVQVLNSCGMM
jgi:3-carboxy-cis,cis-muconate cycloisomerase